VVSSGSRYGQGAGSSEQCNEASYIMKCGGFIGWPKNCLSASLKGFSLWNCLIG
jgi:hypothetical protein